MKLFVAYRRKLLIVGSTISAFLFVALTLYMRHGRLNQFDWNITVKLQDNLSRHLNLTQWFCSLSVSGNFEVLLLVLIGMLLVFRRKNIIGIIITIGLFLGAHAVEVVGKFVLDHPNPRAFFIKCFNPTFPTSYVNPGYSYPSGHSLRIVFLTTLFVYFIIMNKKLNLAAKVICIAPALGILAVMLISRISLGEHWPTDVIGGSFLGLTFALLSLIFL